MDKLTEAEWEVLMEAITTWSDFGPKDEDELMNIDNAVHKIWKQLL